MESLPSQEALWREGREHVDNVQDGEMQLENRFYVFHQDQMGWYSEVVRCFGCISASIAAE